MILYKKGYLVRVTSYVGDADYYRTKEIQVFTHNDLQGLVAFIKLFDKYGNMHYDDKEFIAFTKDLVDVNNKYLLFVADDEENDDIGLPTEEIIWEYAQELAYILDLAGNEDIQTSQLDKLEIYEFMTDITVKEITV